MEEGAQFTDAGRPPPLRHADSRITQRAAHSSPRFSTARQWWTPWLGIGGRHQSEWVNAIPRNGWTPSIGTAGRHQSQSLVAITRCAQRELRFPARCQIGPTSNNVIADLLVLDVRQRVLLGPVVGPRLRPA